MAFWRASEKKRRVYRNGHGKQTFSKLSFSFHKYYFHSKTIVFIPKLSFLFQKNQSKNDQFQDYCCHSKTLAFPNFENDCFKKYCFPERPFLKQLLRFFFLKTIITYFHPPQNDNFQNNPFVFNFYFHS